MLNIFERARKRATPLIAIKTQNWQGTIAKLAKIQRGDEPDPAITWNYLQGVKPINKEGQGIMSLFVDAEGDDATKSNPALFLERLMNIEVAAICFFILPKDVLNGNDADGSILQGISNLREPLKATGSSLVILASDIILPSFLQQDVVVLEDPLPDEEALKTIIRATYKNWDMKEPDETIMLKAVDCLRGLSDFAAEQAMFMCMTKEGIDLNMLWNQKRELVGQTPGLNVHEGKETFEDVGGCESIKEFLSAIFNGKEAPRAIVWVDEIEKALQGSTGGDLSGVSSDQLSVLLVEMQKNNYPGLMFVGFPGTGKSFVAQTAGKEFNVPTIVFDMGAMKGGGLVGQAEKSIRTACRITESISGGNALWIATCNSIANLPPELRRRFKLGTYFFDLPDAEGRKKLWEIYISRFGLETIGAFKPEDEGWTGSEIRNCCEISWRTGKTLVEAGKRITTIVRAMPETIKRLRREANGRYQDANDIGAYQINVVQQKELQRNIAAWGITEDL